MRHDAAAQTIRSARPAMTAALMAETGLDEAILTTLVQRFYDKVRADLVLGPVFARRITDWEPHLAQMVEFWGSVALMTGRYHGSPVAKHADLPVTWAHFERWLVLFRETAGQVCPPAGAAHVIARAERIARSLNFAIEDAARDPGVVPDLARSHATRQIGASGEGL